MIVRRRTKGPRNDRNPGPDDDFKLFISLMILLTTVLYCILQQLDGIGATGGMYGVGRERF
jgi:hypothetical protein